MSHRIAIVGGMRRTGTNFVNYLLSLHPNICVLHTPDLSPISHGKIASFRDLMEAWGRSEVWTPKDPPAKFNKFVTTKDRRNYTHIAFKRDFAETICGVFGNLDIKSVLVWCARDLVETYGSEIRFFKFPVNKDTATEFIRMTQGSMDALRNAEKMAHITILPIRVRWSLDSIMNDLSKILEVMDLRVSDVQTEFLENRWAFKVSTGSWDINEASELLYSIPEFRELNGFYNGRFLR